MLGWREAYKNVWLRGNPNEEEIAKLRQLWKTAKEKT
ncbi:hypothetical protein E2C01_066464 [Portunus trituberculatus]|uniref:Uncharacterized protein n=1 Tax=Portunus trituberculatus TaxID=210409 RepID=A0A5B7HI84_PORTR|nr:hypothetical protein [Portunus trituberculatus]